MTLVCCKSENNQLSVVWQGNRMPATDKKVVFAKVLHSAQERIPEVTVVLRVPKVFPDTHPTARRQSKVLLTAMLKKCQRQANQTMDRVASRRDENIQSASARKKSRRVERQGAPRTLGMLATTRWQVCCLRGKQSELVARRLQTDVSWQSGSARKTLGICSQTSKRLPYLVR